MIKYFFYIGGQASPILCLEWCCLAQNRSMGWVGRHLKDHGLPIPPHGQEHLAPGWRGFGQPPQVTLRVRSSSGCSWSSTPMATGGCAHICLAPCLLRSCCDGLIRYFMSWAVFLLWWWVFFCFFFVIFFFLIEGMCEFLV